MTATYTLSHSFIRFFRRNSHFTQVGVIARLMSVSNASAAYCKSVACLVLCRVLGQMHKTQYTGSYWPNQQTDPSCSWFDTRRHQSLQVTDDFISAGTANKLLFNCGFKRQVTWQYYLGTHKCFVELVDSRWPAASQNELLSCRG